jgi:hypothetical protein
VAKIGGKLPTFRGNLSVHSPKVKQPKKYFTVRQTLAIIINLYNQLHMHKNIYTSDVSESPTCFDMS